MKKKVGLILGCVLFVILAVGSVPTDSGKTDSKTDATTSAEKKEVIYEKVTTKELIDALQDNALNAKEKYKDNPQELQRRTAEIYKENGVNPLGGCLPLLIQMPIFVALYYAFIGDAIPADAKFLWFTLKQPDRLFMLGKFAFNLLPILNVGVTFIQQKIMTSATSGQETNQQMQSMLYMMPLMMLFIFYNMPSGVTLYYLVSGALSLVQQYFILKGRSDDGKDSIKGTE